MTYGVGVHEAPPANSATYASGHSASLAHPRLCHFGVANVVCPGMPACRSACHRLGSPNPSVGAIISRPCDD
eukprot:1284930-Pyramimonas_sp.AAC.1